MDDAVIIALGSNLPGEYASSLALLEAAVKRFDVAGLRVLSRSLWWRSAAWPDPTKPDYLNGVALVETSLSPREVMAGLLRLEAKFGRRRGEPNAPRTLDLDLIAYGRAVIEEPGLMLPHPRAHTRRFVMGPLAEIAPEWRHPTTGLSARALAASSPIGEDAAPA